MRNKIEGIIREMEQEVTRLNEEWDRLDSQAMVEAQNKLVVKRLAIEEEIKNLKNLITILEG